MVTLNNAHGLSLALAHAASRPATGPHLPGSVGSWVVLAGLAAVAWGVYRVSLWLHPFAMCRRCGGTGHITGFWPWSRAFCYKCHGRGLVPRFGTKLCDLGGRYPR
jgi:hypothetical protein